LECLGEYNLCSGTATACSTFGTQGTCQAQGGCTWGALPTVAAAFMNGKVGVGTTSPDVNLDVSGDAEFGLPSTGSTVDVYAVAGGSNGGTYKLVRYSSSERYKYDIKDFNLGLETVLKMHPIEFTWKSTGERDFGFIAEEAEKVNPFLITYLNGQPEAFRHAQYTAVLTNAIQEQQKQIEELKAATDQVSSSTTTNADSDATFAQKVKKAIIALKSWLENQIIKVKGLIADKIFAKKIRVEQLEMVDKATGEIYCTWIENGEWKKTKGGCE
jgi:hypothetical protein